MKRQLGAMLVAGVLLCGTLAWAQSGDTSSSQPGSSSSSPYLFTNSSPDTQNGSGDPTQNGSGTDDTQSGTSGPQDTFTHPETLPALSVFSDTISHTGLSISTTAGSIAQYVHTDGYPGYWDTLNNIGGGISIAQFKPSYSWTVNYTGGLDVSTGYSIDETDLSQNAYGGFNWNFAKRWQLRLKDSYFYSDNPFTPFLTYLGTPTPNYPNPVFYYPQAIVEQNQANLDITYELSPHDILNFQGSEGFQRYIRGGASALWNSVSYSGGMEYQHTLSAQLA